MNDMQGYCIKKALEEIDDEGDYEETLMEIIEKYYAQRIGKYESYILRQKTYKHALSKGFESELIAKKLEKLPK